jgi:hypothetical protein
MEEQSFSVALSESEASLTMHRMIRRKVWSVLLMISVLGCRRLKYVLRLRGRSMIVSRTTEESALMEFSLV